MIYRVSGITIETRYDSMNNIWFANAYDRDNCYFKNRRLREGVYPFFNGITANVSYNGKSLTNTSVQPSPNPPTTPVYTGNFFDVSAQITGINGIAWDGSSFWVVDGSTDSVYNYDLSSDEYSSKFCKAIKASHFTDDF